MCRPIWGIVALVLSGSGSAQTTQFRQAHAFVIECQAGQTVTVVAHCVGVGPGPGPVYPDPLRCVLYGPDGTRLARSEADPGEALALAARVPDEGFCLLWCDPGRNAFTMDCGHSAWGLDLTGRERRLEVTTSGQPLFFWVPEGRSEFSLQIEGEEGTVTVVDPAGQIVAVQDVSRPPERPLRIQNATPGAWQVQFALPEDLSITFPTEIPPLLFPQPITSGELDRFLNRPLMSHFDGQPMLTKRLLDEGSPDVVATVQGRGLSLGFRADGAMVSVRADGVKTAGPERAWGGFAVWDVGRAGEFTKLRGEVQAEGGSVRFRSEETQGLQVNAAYTPFGDGVRVKGSLHDTSGIDRAVTLYFLLPIRGSTVKWWDDLDRVRVCSDRTTYGHWASTPAGACGQHSLYPFGCVTTEAAGVALGLRLDRPLLHRLGYEAGAGVLYIAADVGLSATTEKFPSRADWDFVVYPCDPEWGFRDAARGYYTLFPELFEKRVPDGGWLVWGSPVGLPIEEFRLLYHWGPSDAEAVRAGDELGLYSLLYSDSCRYFADLGPFDHRPTDTEAAAVFQKLLTTEDPVAFLLSRPETATGRKRYEAIQTELGEAEAEKWLRRGLEAARRSAAHGPHGELLVGYLLNRQDWGPANWWTGRLFCNVDPDFPGGFGQYLYQDWLWRVFDAYDAQGAHFDGVGLDNYFTYAHYLNFRREHFATVDHPLTFDAATLRPAILGDTCLFEWVQELRRKLRTERGERQILMANTCGLVYPFAATLLDVNGYEWNVEQNDVIGRVLAYHKPLTTLPMKPEHYQDPWLRRWHLRFGIFPGNPGPSRLEPGQETGELYRRYLPILIDQAALGWEPVPHARATDPHLRVERFGHGERVLFSLWNSSRETVTTEVVVDSTTLELGPAVQVWDRISRVRFPTQREERTLNFPVTLEGDEVTVIEIGRKT